MRIEITKDNLVLPYRMWFVSRQSDVPFMPDISDETETVPGVDGEKRLSSRYGSGNHILVFRSFPDISPEQKDALILDMKNLMAFGRNRDIEIHYHRSRRTYTVRYVGVAEKPQEYENWIEFRLSFKAYDPKGYEDFERSITYEGVADNLGNDTIPARIEFTGPVTNPSVTINGAVYAYTGSVPDGSRLVVDASKRNAVIVNATGAEQNVNSNWNGRYVTMPPGNLTSVTKITNADKKFALYWRNRWA